MKLIKSFAACLLAACLAGCAAQDRAGANSAPGETASEALRRRPEQEFDKVEIELSEGTLYLYTGEAFAADTHGDNDTLTWEVQDGVLYLKKSRGGEAQVTLPANYTYETLSLTVHNGHLYADDTLTADIFEMTMEQGEARVKVNAANSGKILVRRGTVFARGGLGREIELECREGHLDVQMPFGQSECNYSLSLSRANVQLGTESFHGRTETRGIDNGAQRSMSIICEQGDISVVFDS